MLEQLYNDRIMSLAGSLKADNRLEHADATVQMDSPLCGSSIRVDVALDDEGRIGGYGQQVRACALGQSSAAIMAGHAVGKSLDEMRHVRDALSGMLAGECDPPDGEWSELEVLLPARRHKSRHASIMLPFRAVVKAMEQALAARQGRV